MKISPRTHLSTAVTDILLKRGNKALSGKLIDNPNALVSEEGFARVITPSTAIKISQAAIAARNDVPDELRVWLNKTLSG